MSKKDDKKKQQNQINQLLIQAQKHLNNAIKFSLFNDTQSAMSSFNKCEKVCDDILVKQPGYSKAIALRRKAELYASLITRSLNTINNNHTYSDMVADAKDYVEEYVLKATEKYDDINERLQKADSLVESQDYVSAVKEYTSILSIRFKSVDYRLIIHYQRGKAHQALSNYSSAISDYSNAIKLAIDRDDKNVVSEVYLYRGKIHHTLKNYKSAIRDFNEIIKLNSTLSNTAYLELGFIYMELKKYNKAIYNLEKSLELNPELMEAQVALADCQDELDELNEKELIEQQNKEEIIEEDEQEEKQEQYSDVKNKIEEVVIDKTDVVNKQQDNIDVSIAIENKSKIENIKEYIDDIKNRQKIADEYKYNLEFYDSSISTIQDCNEKLIILLAQAMPISIVELIIRELTGDPYNIKSIDDIVKVSTNKKLLPTEGYTGEDAINNLIKDFDRCGVFKLVGISIGDKGITWKLINLLKYISHIRNRLSHIDQYEHYTRNKQVSIDIYEQERTDYKSILQYAIDRTTYPHFNDVTFYQLMQIFDTIVRHYRPYEVSFVTKFEQFVNENIDKLPVLRILLPNDKLKA